MKQDKEYDYNTLILLLGMLNGKLDEIISVLHNIEHPKVKREILEHISKKGIDVQ